MVKYVDVGNMSLSEARSTVNQQCVKLGMPPIPKPSIWLTLLIAIMIFN